jgi:AcrR family transcriptional regulator
MSAEDRRQHIIDTARTLFAQRPYGAVSTQDIADAAGVARSLVHHYFRGIKDVFLAVVASSGPSLADVRTAGPDTPYEERVAHNVRAALDVADDNRETWMAVVGHGIDSGDPEIRALVAAIRERSIERMLDANADILRDTPRTRLALRSFHDFSGGAIRDWLTGLVTRADVEAVLIATGVALFRDVDPVYNAAP